MIIGKRASLNIGRADDDNF